MPTITLTVGLPGCGKTTWAVEEVRKARSKTVNINRDDIRESMAGSHDFYKFVDANEQYVTDLQFSAANQAKENSWNIIVSDTNLNSGFRQRWKQWAKDNGYDYKEKNFLNDFVPKEDRGVELHEYFKVKEFVKQCKERNLKRERSVPNSVLDNMVQKYYTSTMQIPKIDLTDFYEYVIVDVDGTLAHRNSRNPYDESTVLQDTPDVEVIKSVVAEAQFYGRKIIIMSGRHITCQADTEEWLQLHGVPYDMIFMRAEDDSRPDDAVKFELYMNNIHGKYNVVKVYDDRSVVVAMWRELLGLKVFAVEPGNF